MPFTVNAGVEAAVPVHAASVLCVPLLVLFGGVHPPHFPNSEVSRSAVLLPS